MTREEACQILGVTDKSLHSEIERRYSILIKRYHAEKNSEKMDEITTAYNTINGTVVLPPVENPRMRKVVFGKTRAQWLNILYYGKWKYIAIAAAVLFAGYIIYSIVTNTPADFKLAEIGDFTYADSEKTEAYIKGLYPDFDKIEISPVYLIQGQENTAQGMAYLQKAMVVLTAGGEDVVVVDREVFEGYAPMGAFLPLDSLYDELQDLDGIESLSIKPAMASTEDSSGLPGEEKIYGIDVSDSQLLNAIGIYSNEQILTISVKTEREALAKDFIQKLFRQTEELLPQVTWFPTATPAPESGDAQESAPAS